MFELNQNCLNQSLHVLGLTGVRSAGKMTLMNQEDCDLKFKVDPNSLYCGSWGQTIDVQPMKGIVPGQGHVDLK